MFLIDRKLFLCIPLIRLKLHISKNWLFLGFRDSILWISAKFLLRVQLIFVASFFSVSFVYKWIENASETFLEKVWFASCKKTQLLSNHAQVSLFVTKMLSQGQNYFLGGVGLVFLCEKNHQGHWHTFFCIQKTLTYFVRGFYALNLVLIFTWKAVKNSIKWIPPRVRNMSIFYQIK